MIICPECSILTSDPEDEAAIRVFGECIDCHADSGLMLVDDLIIIHFVLIEADGDTVYH